MISIFHRLLNFKSFITMNSANNNNNNNNANKMNNNRQVYRTFCKVCQDSGKTEREYTSHNVRDARGATCCPTLLAQECRNCYKRGHTSKYCTQKAPAAPGAPVKAPLAREAPREALREALREVVSKNLFMCLDNSDSDSEEEKTGPAPVPKTDLKVAEKQSLNYGKIIALAPEIVKKEAVAAFIKETKKTAEKTQAKIMVAHAPMKAPFSWANCESDSEGDEDEEDNSSW